MNLTGDVKQAIASIPAAAWDACAGTDDPVVSHAYLSALEDSGSIGPRTGYQPTHVLLRAPSGDPVAAAPCYLKHHGAGEFEPRQDWAALHPEGRAGLYPKLVTEVPLTPVGGRHLLCRPDAPPDTAALLVGSLEMLATHNGFSSVHAGFPGPADRAVLERAGWLTGQGIQFHWRNAGYSGFDDMLGRLRKDRRKTIRRERRVVAEQGVTLHLLRAAEMQPADRDAFHAMHADTMARNGAPLFLTRAFLDHLAALGDRALFLMARQGGAWIAGLFMLRGRDRLLTRHWGALKRLPMLYFEVCLYGPIDVAIAEGLAVVEGGAGGLYKLARGFEPVPVYSAHWFREPDFRPLAATHLRQAGDQAAALLARLQAETPFCR